MSDIISIPRYATDMSRSLDEKLFFLSKIRSNSFVDYGCADGVLGAEILRRQPTTVYRGFDLSKRMIERGKFLYPSLGFFDSWNRLIADLDTNERPILILSSIIHEVYSYSSPKEIDRFWLRVLDHRWSGIIIRDMIPADLLVDDTTSSADAVRDALPSWIIDSFEARWGSIGISANLMHLLLKYRYERDWKRELDENYMPIDEKQLMNIIGNRYQVAYHRRNTPSFLKQKALQDIGVSWPNDVHLSLILTSNNQEAIA
jgi:hypothetical protein